MTASIHALGSGADAGQYYINLDGRNHGRDEYYTAGSGIWWSSGETLVRTNAIVDPATFRVLCAGLDPRTGMPLVKGAGKGHRAGWDVCLSACKSFSVLWAAGNEHQRAELLLKHDAAVDRALAFAADEGLFQVRLGAGGHRKEHATDVIVGRFRHASSRSGDPNIHTHCVFMNVAASNDGRYRTLEPARLFEFQLVVGAAYRAELSKNLHAVGFAARPAGANQFEIAGVPSEVLDAFSKRSAQIRAVVGPDASAAEKEVAALATRQSKDEVPLGPELEDRWKAELAASGVDVWQRALDEQSRAVDRAMLASSGPNLDPAPIEGEGAVVRAASSLFAHETVLTRKSLLHRAFVEGSYEGRGIDALQADIREIEIDGRLTILDGTKERPTAWSTNQFVALEDSLRKSADRLNERNWFDGHVVHDTLLAHAHLSEEQSAAVIWASGRDGVSIVEAGAGTGKTTLASAIIDAAKASNLRVFGLAPSWVAADQLRRGTGIDAVATAKWRHDMRADREMKAWDASTLVIVDEGGMVGVHDMEEILRTASKASAKVVILGDRRQLLPVGPGGALRIVADVVEHNATLQAVRRQQVDWQRRASEAMGRGDCAQGLFAYLQNDRLLLVSGESAAKQSAIAEWTRLRQTHGEDAIILTRRNRDATDLNVGARAQLRLEGRLRGEDIQVETTVQTGKVKSISIAVGDCIRFKQSDKNLTVRNGTLGTIVEIIPSQEQQNPRLRVKIDGNRSIEFDWRSLGQHPNYVEKHPAPRIVHAYAGTVHAAQGRTVDTSVLYVGAKSDAREIYVGMTRHRHDAAIVVESGRLEAIAGRRQTDRRGPPTKTELIEALLKEAEVFHEKANVQDFQWKESRSIIRHAFELARNFAPIERIAGLAEAIERVVAKTRSMVMNRSRDDGRSR